MACGEADVLGLGIGEAHLTGSGGLKFHDEPLGSVFAFDGKEWLKAKDQPTTLGHYERHLQRNDKIREVLSQSEYMMTSSLVYTGGAVAKASGFAAAGTMIATGLAIGGALIAGSFYLASQTTSSDAAGEILGIGIALGASVIGGMSSAGADLFGSVNESVDESTQKALDLAKTYRFVRYLPSKVHLFWGEKPLEVSVRKASSSQTKLPQAESKSLAPKVSTEGPNESLKPFLKTETSESQVQFYYSPL